MTSDGRATAARSDQLRRSFEDQGVEPWPKAARAASQAAAEEQGEHGGRTSQHTHTLPGRREGGRATRAGHAAHADEQRKPGQDQDHHHRDDKQPFHSQRSLYRVPRRRGIGAICQSPPSASSSDSKWPGLALSPSGAQSRSFSRQSNGEPSGLSASSTRRSAVQQVATACDRHFVAPAGRLDSRFSSSPGAMTPDIAW
jgi:hypothetical protein